MKKLVVVAVSMVATACAPFTPAATCEVKGLGAVHFEKMEKHSCRYAELALELAKQSIIETGAATQEEFDNLQFENVTIWVVDYDNESNTSRGYYENWHIQVTPDMLNLAHEMLHHKDTLDGALTACSTVAHIGWDDNHFRDASDQFKHDVKNKLWPQIIEENRNKEGQ